VKDEWLEGSKCDGKHKTAKHNYTLDLFNELYAGGKGTAPDFIDMHVFSNDPAEYYDYVNAMRAFMDRSGDCFKVGGPYKPLLQWGAKFFENTELVIGAFAPEKGDRDQPLAAPVTAAALMVFQDAGVSRAYIYRAAKNVEGGKVTPAGIMSCDADATPRPTANVYRFWNALMKVPRPAPAAGDITGALVGTIDLGSHDSNLYVLSAHTAAIGSRIPALGFYDRYLLVANVGPATITFEPRWTTGKADLAAHTAKEEAAITSDNTSDGTTFSAIPAATTVVSLKGYEVKLIRLRQ
jgi:hypothetical protein